MDTTCSLAPVRGYNPHMRVQLQFDDHGHDAGRVEAWLQKRYGHLDCHCSHQPGLVVSLALNGSGDDDSYESWQARLVASLSPVDVALEVLAECFTDLDIQPARLVSMHVTG